MHNIVILDPGIDNEGNENATNLGDIIISRAVFQSVQEMFPDKKIYRIPSHKKISDKNYKIIKKSQITFVAGTNLLSSNKNQLNRPLGPIRLFDYLHPKLKNLVLFGVGWGYGYDEPINLITKYYYKYILFSKKSIHSVRDQYSEAKLQKLLKVNNTNCPTMWKLNGIELDLNKPIKKTTKCLFTLTDYLKDYDNDDALLQYLINKFDTVVFFPQGKWDLQYIQLLPTYVKNVSRFQLLNHSISEYDKFVETEDFVYIGTRLHGGIRCLQAGRPAYIITIDNRAEEIAKDTGLSSGPRGDINSIENWLEGKSNFGNLRLNLVGIDSFLSAYK